jgi:cytochrome P450
VGLTKKLLTRFHTFSEANAAIEIRSEMMRYTVDVTSELAFGYAMNNLEDNHDNIRHHLKVIFPALFKRINSPVPYWRYFKLPADRKLDNALKAISQIIGGIIHDARKRLAEDETLKENPTNFLQALIVACEQDDSLSNELLIGNVLTMLLAGEDTTAHTLAWILYFVHLNPEVQHKMQQEADQVLKGEVLTSFEDATKLRYIEAVAFEAMRLKPVGPVMFFDTLEEVVIGKVKVPKDTWVFMQTQYASISEKHFSDAQAFLPERWLGNQCPVHNQKASVPFGAGPRYCPGHGLAMIEIKSILSMVCKNFHVTMETDPREVKEVLAFTMMPTGFKIRLKKRN